MAVALATQQHVVALHIQYVPHHVFAALHQKVLAVPGLNGVLVLLATQEPAQELAQLVTHALQPKPKIAGTAQHLLTLTALAVLKAFSLAI